MFINETTWEYISQHESDDVRKLALQGARPPELDLTAALQQIAGRQTARKKLPSWAAVDRLLYPPHLNMEQCSSEQTAHYKALLAQRLTAADPDNSYANRTGDDSIVDLTGGLGVDFYWMSRSFRHRTYVEQNAELCAIARQNFQTLGLPCTTCCADAVAYLHEMAHTSLVFLDPARRNEHGGRTYRIEDCSPNVLELLPLLLEKSDFTMLKLSPMLDWRKAVGDLQCVSEVHIVSVDNECKELLLVLSQEQSSPLRVACVNNARSFEFIPTVRIDDSHGENSVFSRWETSFSLEQANGSLYLYEPNASVMKAGCFVELAERFPVRQIAQNSHLFLSPVEIDDFPGRGFQIQAISSMNKREVKQKFSSLKSANISVRNFPLSADQLRHKLKLKDGGDVYIFATTLQNGEYRLFACRKIS